MGFGWPQTIETKHFRIEWSAAPIFSASTAAGLNALLCVDPSFRKQNGG